MALKDHNMKNLLLPKPNSPNTMNTQHTPGPWKADHSGFGDAKVIAHNGWKNKAGSPFNPTIIERIDWPTARLIAAAPDLLAALIKCKEAVENGNLPPSARMELVRDYATPAITKAKGH